MICICRSSSSNATAAFAVATAGSAYQSDPLPIIHPMPPQQITVTEPQASTSSARSQEQPAQPPQQPPKRYLSTGAGKYVVTSVHGQVNTVCCYLGTGKYVVISVQVNMLLSRYR